jgi:hypothetical protein
MVGGHSRNGSPADWRQPFAHTFLHWPSASVTFSWRTDDLSLISEFDPRV